MNSYDFFMYEFIYFKDSYMNSGVPRFQMWLKQGSVSSYTYHMEFMAWALQA